MPACSRRWAIKVTLIEQRDRLIGFLDTEVSAALRRGMEALGIRFCMNETVVSVSNDVDIDLHLKSGHTVSGDAVLVSSGRNSNTAGLGLECIGLELGKRGLIPVDEHYQTKLPHIYAAGDVIGDPRPGLDLDGAGPGGDGPRLRPQVTRRAWRRSSPTGSTPSPSARWPAPPKKP